MALFFAGKTRCAVCEQPVFNEALPVLFPAFVSNRSDPLFPFHDAVVHRACAEGSALGREALRVREEVFARCGPGNRKCIVCDDEIMDYNDYFGTGYLVPREHPLAEFNYLHIHLSHFTSWDRADEFRQRVMEFESSPAWDGPRLHFDPLPRVVPVR